MSRNFDHKLKKNLLYLNPFNFKKPSISNISIKIFILLILMVGLLFFTKSYNSLNIIVSSLSASFFASILIYILTKDSMYNIFHTLNQGLLIGLLLPDTFPVITVFFITFFTIFISRVFIFKNINSWINVSAFVVLICWTIGRQYFPEYNVIIDMVKLKNSSLYLIQNGTFPIYPIDNQITNILNSSVFKLFKVTIPDGYISLLLDTHSIIPAFRFNLYIILASIVLFSDNSLSIIIPSVYLAVYGILVRLFVPFFFKGPFNQGDIILALTTSGTLFCSLFMFQCFGTVPITFWGKIIYGAILGFIGFIIIGYGLSPIGIIYTILIGNVISMLFRLIEDNINMKKIIHINENFKD